VISYLEDKFLKLGLFEQKIVTEIPAEITALADQRIQSKKDKNYALADELRNKITEL
jgi:cysteinyl-tRNA synthetase